MGEGIGSKLLAAEHEVNEILRKLEEDTECIVTSIGLRKTEITRIDDAGRRFLIGVEIEAERRPGHDWVGASQVKP
jgi:hypothetical protein